MIKARCFKGLTSLLIMFSLFLASPAFTAHAVKQSEIDEIQKQVDALSVQREESQKKVDELQDKQASVLEQKAALDNRNEYASAQIELINEQIELLDEMIKSKEKEMIAALEKEEEQLARYRSRVRAMEESGDPSLLELFLKSESISDALSAVDDIGDIMESDRRLQQEYLAAKEAVQEIKAEYEAAKADCEGKRRALRMEQSRLEQQVREAYNLIDNLQNDIDKAVEEYEINAAAEDQMVAYLDELSLKFAQEQEAARTGVLTKGTFLWPVPDCKLITSPFGYRIHPILNYERFHAGIDVGAKMNDVIVASDGGTVIVAEYSDSYGNFVMVNHGNGYTTLYAHMSTMAVEVGQAVAQGDTLGYIGSTGWSTGPHLHFEIRFNDEKTDPAQYFDGLTYYNC